MPEPARSKSNRRARLLLSGCMELPFPMRNALPCKPLEKRRKLICRRRIRIHRVTDVDTMQHVSIAAMKKSHALRENHTPFRLQTRRSNESF